MSLPAARRTPVRLAAAVLGPGAVLALSGALLAWPALPAGAASVADEVDAAPGLVVDTSVAAAVRPGERLAYSIRYTNTSGVAVADAVLSATLSTGQAFVAQLDSSPAVPPGRFTQNGLALRWALGPLAAGAAGRLRFETQVDVLPEPAADAPVRLVGNAALLYATGGEAHSGEDSAVARIVGPILELTAADAPDPVLPGHLLTTTLTLVNRERQDAIAATGVVISDRVPAFTHMHWMSPGGGFDHVSNAVVWDNDLPLAVGESMVVTFVVRVDEDAPAGTTIVNDRPHYGAAAREIRGGVIRGKARVTTKVDALLQKAAEAPRRLFGSPTAYPGENVTYTVTVHNPKPYPIAELRVTDTLPGAPVSFAFVRPLSGTPRPLVEGSALVWTDVYLPPWGSARFQYVAHVPARMRLEDNANMGTNYPSALAAAGGGVTLPPVASAGTVRVYPPVALEKTVEPTAVAAGGEVTYTLRLVNRAKLAYTGIRLTDTMEGPAFRYVRMAGGPEPVAGLAGNPVVWEGLAVAPNEKVTLSFVATADGQVKKSYTNDLAAESGETAIPRRTRQAAVRIEPRVGGSGASGIGEVKYCLQMTAAPAFVRPGEDVRYAVTVTNVHTRPWRLESVRLALPLGHLDGGEPEVTLGGTPATIDPGGWWPSAARATAVEVTCADLPRTVSIAPGAMAFDFTAGLGGTQFNADPLAPFRLVPHADLTLTPARDLVQPVQELTYSLRVANDSRASTDTGAFSVALPPAFRFVDAWGGPVPDVEGNVLRWSGISLRPGASLELGLRAESGAGLGKQPSRVTGGGDAAFCIGSPGETATVEVVEEIVSIETKPLSRAVPPRAPLVYELRLKNRSDGPVRLDAVTDTLPAGFVFVSMTQGPVPEVRGEKLVWRDVSVPSGLPTVWKVQVMSGPLYGTFENLVEATSREVRVPPSVGAPVEVLPLVQLSKVAGSPYVRPGETVSYTVRLLNLGTTGYNQIAVTDTLPAGLTFERMLSGPKPSSVGQGGRQPVWTGLSVRGMGGLTALVFEARVAPAAEPGVVFNLAEGAGPSVLIPGTDPTAPITITRSSVLPTPAPTRPRPTPTRPDLGHRLYLPASLRVAGLR